MTLSESLTYSTTKITAILEDNTISTGTGFFMEFNRNNETKTCQPVIITNKHVVEGAKTLIYSECRGDDNNNPIDTKKFTITLDAFKIVNHPDIDVDLCAISISGAESIIHDSNVKLYKGKLTTDNLITDDEIKKCSAMEEIIMIGYPIGLEDTHNNKPIIRRGITSTHIKNDYNGKKEFLIDMPCFPGSSGSPIFICNEYIYNSAGAVIMDSRIRLIGILYGGPQYKNTGKIVFNNIPTMPKPIIDTFINLGVAIKACRIKELEDLMKNLQ